MSHLDEGTLHALLDGELELHELREIQAHLGSCSACDARLQTAKEVFREADRLVGTVQFPGHMRSSLGSAEPEPIAPEPAAAAAPTTGPGPRREPRINQPIYDDLPPVFLPENNEWAERRRQWLGRAKWAALLFVAVGAGYIASETRKSAPPIGYVESERPRLMKSSEDAVVSPEEATGTDSTAGVYRAPPPPSAKEPARPAVRPGASSVERIARNRAPVPAASAPTAQSTTQPESLELAAGDSSVDTANQTPAPQDEARADQFEDEAEPKDVRAEAAAALAELDRQRRRERAAAATAAVDRARRQPAIVPAPGAAAQQAPPPALAPRTLEQRSGIYLRIGLDEAARQLGRPVHVIEGLNAQFMGLAQGRQAPGADDERPVVRVVYQDSQGRMILLDQQRVRPGQNWPSGPTQWVVGEIGLVLHGEPGPAVLRNLRPRVR
jgi:anti-sigma factor RsiW